MYVVGLKQEFPASPVVSMEDARIQIISCSFPPNADFCFYFSSQDLVLVLGVRRFPTPAPKGWVYSFFSPTSNACPWENVCWPSINSLWFAFRREWSRETGAFMPVPGSNSWDYTSTSALSRLLSCPESFSWAPKERQWKRLMTVRTSLVSGTPSYCEMITHNYQERSFSDCFAAYTQPLLCALPNVRKTCGPSLLGEACPPLEFSLLICFANPVMTNFLKYMIFRL